MLSRKLQFGSVFVLGAAMVGATLLSAQEKAAAPTTEEVPHYRAKQILGANVSLSGNTEVGKVDDIVLDANGNVDYLIVVNSENKLVTVPWDAANFNADKRQAVINIAPAQFQQVPTYTVERYPVFAAPTYRTQVYKYYGLTPGQQRRAIKRGAVVVP